MKSTSRFEAHPLANPRQHDENPTTAVDLTATPGCDQRRRSDSRDMAGGRVAYMRLLGSTAGLRGLAITVDECKNGCGSA